MAYQELDIVKAVKAGIIDSDSRRAVWDNATYKQGLKFANDGKTILYAVSAHTIDEGNATWSATLPQAGTYSVLLEKTGGGDTDGSIHLQFAPTAHALTLQDLYDAIDTGAGGALDPVYSFYHKNSAVNGNFAQFELRFEDPISTAWLEVTIMPCQGLAPGSGAWEDEQVAGTTTVVYGGNTIDGSSVWEMGALTLSGLEAAVDIAWDAAEQDTVPTLYELKRVRIELWEANPARTAYIDDVVIDGHNYEVEPGLEGAKIGPNTDTSTLAFVEVPDRFGRLEVLNPTLGAEQALIVGPLLPELFNDSDGFARFKPSSTGVDYTYVAIQVTDPS